LLDARHGRTIAQLIGGNLSMARPPEKLSRDYGGEPAHRMEINRYSPARSAPRSILWLLGLILVFVGLAIAAAIYWLV